jgi:hypothetical protein
VALNDVQFKELIVGKPSTSATRSLVTNRLRGPAPNHRMDAKTPDPAVMGHLKVDPERISKSATDTSSPISEARRSRSSL